MRFLLCVVFIFPLVSVCAAEFPECRVDGVGDLSGNYSAIQQQAYDASCILNVAGPQQPAVNVVPIGRSGGLKASANYTASSEDGGTVRMQLNGDEDNTLSDGLRGRQEVAACFVSKDEFLGLSEQEQSFRRIAHDFYRSCSQATNRSVIYEFGLILRDENKDQFADWDSIVVQLHAVNDKGHYCIPGNSDQKSTCNRSSGVLGWVNRLAADYQERLGAGAVFETDLQPPISFRVKGGDFYIVLAGSLFDENGTPSSFSPGKSCSVNLDRAKVWQVKTCADTGKTSVVAYKAALGTDLLPLNKVINFKMSVTWPVMYDPHYHLRVAVVDEETRQLTMLVDNESVPFGSYDAVFPYFKAGVYRQNGNITPQVVILKGLRIFSL